ncbi:MAG: type II secretion system F family protein [bacterium]|nr:type II secretion system F family protein [bacterium]
MGFDYRYLGLTPAGKLVQGIITAGSKSEARKRAQELSTKHRFKLTEVQKKRTFLYKVQRGLDKPVTGEQKAYAQIEVRTALERLGFKVIRIQPKLFEFQAKPANTDVVMFIRLSADLLREKLPYDEILNLLSNDLQSKALRDVLREISKDLREGKDGKEVFGKHELALGKFTSYMLGVASKSGNMVDIYEATAKFLERTAEFKKNLKSALIMPAIVVLVLALAVMFYVGYIFPKTAEMFQRFNIPLPPMTKATLDFSNFLRDHLMILLVVTVLPVVAIVAFLRTDQGKFLVNRYLIRLPVIGGIAHKTAIEIFCRVFYSLYGGSGENIEAIRVASEACNNRYIERQIKEVAIPMMLKEGKGLVESLEATGVFTENALSRLRSGAETGTIRQTALQVANYYEKETTYKLRTIIDLIQVMIAMLIMVVMTAITIVSSETAVIRPKMPGT